MLFVSKAWRESPQPAIATEGLLRWARRERHRLCGVTHCERRRDIRQAGRSLAVAQLFPQPMNYLARLTIIATAFGMPLFAWFCLMYSHSSYGTNAGVMREQPVPFSHQHHVGVLGIDCRYCHTSVEKSSFAGMPATKICMNCHSQIWVGSQMLAAGARELSRPTSRCAGSASTTCPASSTSTTAFTCTRVSAARSCHGQIDEMPLTYQVPTLLMEWCLDCHRHPERQIRPRAEVFNMRYQPPDDQLELGRQLSKLYDVKEPLAITSCSMCHR